MKDGATWAEFTHGKAVISKLVPISSPVTKSIRPPKL